MPDSAGSHFAKEGKSEVEGSPRFTTRPVLRSVSNRHWPSATAVAKQLPQLAPDLVQPFRAGVFDDGGSSLGRFFLSAAPWSRRQIEEVSGDAENGDPPGSRL